VVGPSNLQSRTVDVNILLWGGKRINPDPGKAARRTDPEQAPSLGNTNKFVVRARVIIMRLNVEEIKRD